MSVATGLQPHVERIIPVHGVPATITTLQGSRVLRANTFPGSDQILVLAS